MKFNTKRIVALLALLLIPLLFMTSCTVSTDDSERIHALTVKMINAIKTGDSETAFELVQSACTQEEFDEKYVTLEPIFLDISSYELRCISVSTEEAEGKKYEYAQYILLSDEKTLELQVTMDQETQMLYGFRSSSDNPEAKTYITTSGTITTLDKTSGWQWVLLAVSLLEIAFVIWMAIDCMLHKVESKFLWMSLILLGMFTLSFSYGDGSFSFNFGISFILEYTSLVGHVKDLVTLRVMVPAGAVVYLFMRKKLHSTAAKKQAEAAEKPKYRSYIPDDEK